MFDRVSDETRGYERELEQTRRELAESQAMMDQSLANQRVLIRELYHRTKNNLQVVSNLISLQRERQNDPEVRDTFQKAIDRIQSLSLAQSKLYENQDLCQVSLRSYIEEIAERLWCSSGSPANVSFAFDLAEVSVPIDIAMPVGLIVNELVSNSLRHAFRDGAAGTIQISLTILGDGSLRLTYSDTGVGLEPGFHVETDSELGLDMVRILAEQQLGGEFVVGGTNGFLLELRFSDRRYPRHLSMGGTR